MRACGFRLREQGALVLAQKPLRRKINLIQSYLFLEGAADFPITFDQKHGCFITGPPLPQLHELFDARILEAGDFFGAHEEEVTTKSSKYTKENPLRLWSFRVFRGFVGK